MDVIIENVRCFAGRHLVPITPLTLIVGENSTGKTTFLSVVSTVCRSNRFPGRHGFNDPPFDLGGYDSVATLDLSSGRLAPYFRIGFAEGSEEDATETVATYEGHHGQIRFHSIETTGRYGRFRLEQVSESDFELLMRVRTHGRDKQDKSFTLELPKQFDLSASSLPNLLFVSRKLVDEIDPTDLRSALKLLHAASWLQKEVLPVAPIRTRPFRTYDQFTDEFLPGGEHVPMMLASLLCLEESRKKRDHLMGALERFGTDSGLFESVSVTQLGKESRPPFQVKVTIAGRKVNLADVGYGVSQSLPIVVQSLLSSPQSLLLLQQPEVHLHPKAQAALGTLFAALSRDNAWFIVETHSDYLVDRVRQEVGRGSISPHDVSILFFDKEGASTRVYPLSLDERGDIVDAPPQYRAFFLEEGLNLLAAGGGT